MRKSKKIWTYALLQRDGSYENKKGVSATGFTQKRHTL